MLRQLRKITPLTGLLLALVLGLVVVQFASGNQNPPAPPKDQFTPTALSPEEVAERKQQHQTQSAASEEMRLLWLATFHASGIDTRTLEKVDLHAEAGPPPSSLDAAVDTSDIVAIGTVVEIRYDSVSSILTVELEEAAKGSVVTAVTVAVVGGPRPTLGQFETFVSLPRFAGHPR